MCKEKEGSDFPFGVAEGFIECTVGLASFVAVEGIVSAQPPF